MGSAHTSSFSTKQPAPTPASRIERDPDLLRAYLSDAAHVPGGFASGVATPSTVDEVATLVRDAERVLPIGAQSSLTGGATPRGELVLSTRRLQTIGQPSDERVRVGAGVPLVELQRALAASGLYYPPVPTYDGAFVGGTISTNAAGPATFKYGTTRDWVDALTIVLADGSVLDLSRGDVMASPDGRFEWKRPDGPVVPVPVPTYAMPAVPKLSAGYFARPGMDLVDLFVGSEGTLGVIVEATLRVVPRPRKAVALVRCAGDAEAVALTAALRREAAEAWRGRSPLDVAAIEYMDARALSLVPDDAFAKAGVTRPPEGTVLLLIQIETLDEDDAALDALQFQLDAIGIEADPAVALPGDDAGAARMFALRESVPASLNTRIGRLQAEVHADIQKTAGDLIVPFDRLEEAIRLYRETFDRHGLQYAIWGHISDGNLHPNVVPSTRDDVVRGREAIVEMAAAVMRMGGAPLAEHGVGRSAMKQRLLHDLYGEAGIAQMRAVKQALDPGWKLSPGVLFPR